MAGILYPEESYAIMGACFEVCKRRGCGFDEPAYQECMEIELDFQRIPFASQPELKIEYRGRVLRKHHTPDFICFDKIILELKAVSELADEHRAQVFNYLRATGLQLGILANFGHHPGLEYERIVLTRPDGLGGPSGPAPGQS